MRTTNENDDLTPTSDAGRSDGPEVVANGEKGLARLSRFTRRIVRVPVKDVRKLEKKRRSKKAHESE